MVYTVAYCIADTYIYMTVVSRVGHNCNVMPGDNGSQQLSKW